MFGRKARGEAGTTPEGWRVERRKMPGQLLAEAAANPGGGVAEIDGSRVPDPNGYVPTEAIRGYFTVDNAGRPTGDFIHNPNFGPIRDDWAALNVDHWLGWLPDEPPAAIRSALLTSLTDQVPGAELEWVKIIPPPEFLTGGIPDPKDASKVTVVRAGLAVAFALSVVTPAGHRSFLQGAFSWDAVGLNQPGARQDRTWFDLGAEILSLAATLESRMHFEQHS